MATAPLKHDLDEPVTQHMRPGAPTLRVDQTVGEALDWLRLHPPPERIIYLYVIDEAGVLKGVVPTRRLILSAPTTPIADMMVTAITTIPARATVLEACEFFILFRLLAYPVVDDEGKLVGVVDIDLYTDELQQLERLTPAARWLEPLARFFRVEAAGGIILLACTIIALVLANSPWSDAFGAFWKTPLGFAVGGFELKKTLLLWINDGLMTLFFFVVGLEIKREFVGGELSDWRKAVLPIVAALGGMLAPALIFLAFTAGTPSARGWGIPTATDIAFVVGLLTLLGPRVPHGLKVLLLTLAIADDIGATLVIAIAYTSDLSLEALSLGLAGFGVVIFFRSIGVRHTFVYVIVGALIWLAFLKARVHPTVAGVALGLLTPARPLLGDRAPFDLVSDLFQRLGGLQGEAPTRRERESPLDRLEHALHPFVAFLIMPVFALANAGVAIDTSATGTRGALAVCAGLVVGKPLGIVLLSWLSVRLGLTQLPSGVTVKVLFGAGCLAGIGFTMSLFIAALAFDGHHLAEAKIGILVGSFISAVLGSLLLWRFLPAPPT